VPPPRPLFALESQNFPIKHYVGSPTCQAFSSHSSFGTKSFPERAAPQPLPPPFAGQTLNTTGANIPPPPAARIVRTCYPSRYRVFERPEGGPVCLYADGFFTFRPAHTAWLSPPPPALSPPTPPPDVPRTCLSPNGWAQRPPSTASHRDFFRFLPPRQSRPHALERLLTFDTSCSPPSLVGIGHGRNGPPPLRGRLGFSVLFP